MAKEAALKIGNSFVNSSAIMKDVSDAIISIFKSGFENRMEQQTIIAALKTLGEVAKVENVMVTNSVFNGDKTVNMDKSNEE